ncbi:hypothetical protein K3495_g16584 [Podosphaera aphanis]|nr:hypothetical protein K3495_g16584 [Podosphaera aphanis]
MPSTLDLDKGVLATMVAGSSVAPWRMRALSRRQVLDRTSGLVQRCKCWYNPTKVARVAHWRAPSSRRNHPALTEEEVNDVGPSERASESNIRFHKLELVYYSRLGLDQ